MHIEGHILKYLFKTIRKEDHPVMEISLRQKRSLFPDIPVTWYSLFKMNSSKPASLDLSIYVHTQHV